MTEEGRSKHEVGEPLIGKIQPDFPIKNPQISGPEGASISGEGTRSGRRNGIDDLPGLDD